MGLARSIRAKPRLFKKNQAAAARGYLTHPPSLKLRRTSRLRLSRKFRTFQQNRAGAFHFVERATDVARLKLNSAASVQDDARS